MSRRTSQTSQLTPSDSFPKAPGKGGEEGGHGVRVLGLALPFQKEMLRPSWKEALDSRGFGKAEVLLWGGRGVQSETPGNRLGFFLVSVSLEDYAAAWMGREGGGGGRGALAHGSEEGQQWGGGAGRDM